jgi:hypothetical protein
MLPDGFGKRHDLSMRLMNPANNSIITGESGDELGRGGRATVFVLDETAFVSNPETAERAIIGSTDCVGYVSTVNRPGDFFDQKRLGPGLRDDQKFVLDWRDDPRKDEAWAETKKRTLTDPTAFAREFDRDSNAAVDNQIIRAEWVKSAQRLASLLPEAPQTGRAVAGGDVGGGKAKSVVVMRKGCWVLEPEVRQDPDTTETGYWMLDTCRDNAITLLNYDSVAIGQGVLSTMAKATGYDALTRIGINTGIPPTERIWPDEKTSEEMFGNLKMELWWIARQFLRRSHELCLFLDGKPKGVNHPLSEIVILPSGAQGAILAQQLSLLLYFRNDKGKMVAESKVQLAKRSIASPDHADAFVLSFLESPDDDIPSVTLDVKTFARDNPFKIG